MVLALAATGIVIFALLGEVMLPRLERAVANHRARRRRIPQTAEFDLDPGRERRAEARARQLLKSCVNEEEWSMYRDLGFIRVWGMGSGATTEADDATQASDFPYLAERFQAADAEERAAARRDDARRQAEWERLEGFGERARGRGARRHRLSRRGDVRVEPYAYLIYPHRPILAYVPQTGRLLNEYCVEFPDETRPYGSPRLPDSDDVLAKWMALTGDERRLIGSANMHLPGRQIDPRQVKRDLWRLRQWERERARAASGPSASGGRHGDGGAGAHGPGGDGGPGGHGLNGGDGGPGGHGPNGGDGGPRGHGLNEGDVGPGGHGPNGGDGGPGGHGPNGGDGRTGVHGPNRDDGRTGGRGPGGRDPGDGSGPQRGSRVPLS